MSGFMSKCIRTIIDHYPTFGTMVGEGERKMPGGEGRGDRGLGGRGRERKAGVGDRGRHQREHQGGRGGMGGARVLTCITLHFSPFSQGFYIFPGFLYFPRVSMFPLKHSHLDWPLVWLTLNFHRVSMFLCFSGCNKVEQHTVT